MIPVKYTNSVYKVLAAKYQAKGKN
jgi:hypothetical protein